ARGGRDEPTTPVRRRRVAPDARGAAMNLFNKLWRDRPSSPPGTDKGRRFRPAVEALEQRDVPSARAFLVGGTLQIHAGPTAAPAGGSVEVSEYDTLRTTFVPGRGLVTELVTYLRVVGDSPGGDMTRSFNKREAAQISFSGSGSADTFVNLTNVPCTASGSG